MKKDEVLWGRVDGMAILNMDPVLVSSTISFFSNSFKVILLKKRVRNPLYSKYYNTTILRSLFNKLLHSPMWFPTAGWICQVYGFDGLYFIPESSLIGLEVIGYEFST